MVAKIKGIDIKTINGIMKIRQTLERIKHSFRDYYVFYADSTELLDKAQKLLRPLPDGCKLVKLTNENKDKYKCKWNVDLMLQVMGEAWAVVDNDEIIAWHYGTYRGKESMFFQVENCDFEHIELMVDERYRRNGIGIYLLYHTVKNLNPDNVKNNKVGTCIKPDNIPSIKLHELIGFKKTHRVILFHMTRQHEGYCKYINIPHFTI